MNVVLVLRDLSKVKNQLFLNQEFQKQNPWKNLKRDFSIQSFARIRTISCNFHVKDKTVDKSFNELCLYKLNLLIHLLSDMIIAQNWSGLLQ